jgi:S-formylglutathione hydrolase FrmB
VSRFRTVEVSDPAYESDGLRHVTVHSAALRGRGDLTVWAPPGLADGPGPLPVVVLMHGVYGSHWAWALKAGAHRTAARLVAAGEVPPLVLAMPSDGLWEDGSGYLPRRDRDAESWIVDDVPAAAREAVPAADADAAGMCIAGLSMGGFGALRLGASHPDRYRAVSGLSSITDLAQIADFTGVTPVEAWMDESHTTVIEPMLRNRDRLPPVRFDCGVDDPLIEANRRLHADLDAAGIAHVYEEHPGGHEWPYWTKHLEATLRFFGAALTASGES